jgi:hypothetical protein
VFFYDLTLMSMGENTGFGSVYFSGAAWFTLLGTIVAILVVFVLMLIFVNPLYFGLASSSNDFIAKGKAKAYRFPQHSYFTAQVQKEAILFFKNPDIFSGFFGTFVFMPIYITLIGKMFGAMATNVRGDMMVMAIICLLILMISLNEQPHHRWNLFGRRRCFLPWPVRILARRVSCSPANSLLRPP